MAHEWGSLSAEQLFLNLPEPAIVVASDGRVLAGNPCASELFEVVQPFPQISVVELLTQPERTRLNPLEWLRKWAEQPDAPELEYVYLTCRTQSHAEKQLSVRVSKLPASTCYLVAMHDVSRWEERLHAERDAHRIAARVLAISADAVLITDDEYVVTYANTSAETLFGYAAGELTGRPLADLLPERFRARHGDFMQRFATGSVPSRLMGERAPVLALTRSGEEVAVQATITRITVHNKRMYSAHLRVVQQDM